MKQVTLLSAVFVCLFLNHQVARSQQLSVQTQAGNKVFSGSDLEALPRVEVTAMEHSGRPVKFQGVTLKGVLDKAGVGFGESFKGKGQPASTPPWPRS